MSTQFFWLDYVFQITCNGLLPSTCHTLLRGIRRGSGAPILRNSPVGGGDVQSVCKPPTNQRRRTIARSASKRKKKKNNNNNNTRFKVVRRISCLPNQETHLKCCQVGVPFNCPKEVASWAYSIPHILIVLNVKKINVSFQTSRSNSRRIYGDLCRTYFCNTNILL